MAKVFELTNGAVDCIVVAQTEEEVFNIPAVEEYFYEEYDEDRLEDIDIREIPDDEVISIDFDNEVVIPLMAKWWALIYGDRNQIISQSEY